MISNYLSIMETINANVLVVGSAGSGKSCLINRFINGNFVANDNDKFFRHTMKVKVCSNLLYTMNLNLFEVNDIKNPKAKAKYDATILFYDSSNSNDFNSAMEWVAFLNKNNCSGPILLCANKSDVAEIVLSDHEQIRIKTIHELIGDKKLNAIIKTSAKSCYNFDKPFSWLVTLMCHAGNPCEVTFM